jgi:hypothetical protein
MSQEKKHGFEEFADIFERKEKKEIIGYSIADTYELDDEPVYTLKDLDQRKVNQTIIPNQVE